MAAAQPMTDPATGHAWWDPRAWGGVLAAATPAGRARVPVSWALYDFANTIFSYAVVSYAFGLWLTDPARLGQAQGQLWQSIAILGSVGLNALVSPILGAVSDRGGRRLPYLLVFTVLCIVPSAFIGAGSAALGIVLFVLANFGYQAALIYYDATLKTVSRPETRGGLSGFGVSIGYLGTIFIALLLLLLPLPLEGAFPLQAILFAVFAVPIFLAVRERGTPGYRFRVADVTASWRQVARTIDDTRAVPGLGRFLLGRFFYSDAVNTVIVVMSVFAVRAIGLTEKEANLVLLLLTIVAVLASLGWGRLVDRIGPKRTLLIVLASWAVGLALGAASLSMPSFATSVAVFLVAGAILGSGLGGVQVADRVLMIRLSPHAQLGEFFGLYGLVGKASQVVGQLLYGLVVATFLATLGNAAYQLAIATLFGTMLIGLWLVWPVSDHWAGADEPAAPGPDAQPSGAVTAS